MATYSGNADYVTIDGVDISSYWVDIEVTPSQETADTTAGANVAHRTRNEGLKDHTLSLTVVYDSDNIQTLLPLLKVGEHSIVWGPEGSGTGKPRHAQTFIFTESVTGGTFEKNEKRIYSISAEASAAPTADKWNGAVFP